MNMRFALILFLIAATLLGWTYIQHQFEDSKQYRLNQISDLPVFVYFAEDATLKQLSTEIKAKVPEIDSLLVESGDVVVQSLITEYKLDIEPNTLQQYTLPSVLTIKFKPAYRSFKARKEVQEILNQNKIAKTDIEMQVPAWNLVQKEINYLKQRWGNATLFIAMLVFLLFVFARLYLFLAQSRKPSGMRDTILESLRHSEVKKWQNAFLLGIPILVNVSVYFLLVALKVISLRVDWIFFVIQYAALLTASLVAILLDNMREPDNTTGLSSIKVEVLSPSDEMDT